MELTRTPQSKFHHLIRVSQLKIGNHLLAWLFARQLSILVQGHSDLIFAGIEELGVAGENTDLIDNLYNYTDKDPSYPWPIKESLARTIARRVYASFRHSHVLPKQLANRSSQSAHYDRYALKTNLPNLYLLRSASANSNLLLDVQSAVCNLGYLPSCCEARRLIPGRDDHKTTAKKVVLDRLPETLFVHIRAGDILSANHNQYIPLPINLIRFAKEKLNANLVFIGQLEESEYCRELRLAFPDDEFLHTKSVGLDFEIIRCARKVLISTSTFAWLAAWTSEYNDLILLPNIGLYNSIMAPSINLFDAKDRRFHFINL